MEIIKNEGGEEETLLKPGQVARLFGVSTKTVARWSADGKLKTVVTPGGHRRYRRVDIDRLLDPEPDDAA